MKSIWDILGIDPTTDEKTIKRAYAKKLKECDKNDVMLQQKLHDAFKLARRGKASDVVANKHNDQGDVVETLIKNTNYSEIKYYSADIKFASDENATTIQNINDYDRLLYTTDINVAKDVIENINNDVIDVQMNRIQLLFDFLYHNEVKISYLIGSYLIEEMKLSYYYNIMNEVKNDVVQDVLAYYTPRDLNPSSYWWVQFRLFEHTNDPLYPKYVNLREQMLTLLRVGNYEDVITMAAEHKEVYALWYDELGALKMVALLLNGGIEKVYITYLNECKKMILDKNKNPLVVCCFIALLNKDMKNIKIFRKDYILNDFLYLNKVNTGIRVDVEAIERMNCIANTKIASSIESYMSFYSRYNKDYAKINKIKIPIKSVNSMRWYLFIALFFPIRLIIMSVKIGLIIGILTIIERILT